MEASTDQSSMTVTGWPVSLEQHGHNRAEATQQDTELLLTATGNMASLDQSEPLTERKQSGGVVGAEGMYGAMF